MSIVIVVLLFLLAFVLSFALSFTVVSLYIYDSRKIEHKYHFTSELMEPNIQKDSACLEYYDSNADSAKKEWEKKNNEQF
jgi:hypothetical protein